jgi:hypothetical protein
MRKQGKSELSIEYCATIRCDQKDSHFHFRPDSINILNFQRPVKKFIQISPGLLPWSGECLALQILAAAREPIYSRPGGRHRKHRTRDMKTSNDRSLLKT